MKQFNAAVGAGAAGAMLLCGLASGCNPENLVPGIDVPTGDEASSASPSAAPKPAGYNYPLRYTVIDTSAIDLAYDDRRMSVSDLLRSNGTAFPDPDSQCRAAWQGQASIATGMGRIASYSCWPQSSYGAGWKPQGIAGSAQALPDKNIIVSSWYSDKSTDALVVPQIDKTRTNRLTFIDMTKHVMRDVTLVKPCDESPNGMCNLGSHAGGVAWAKDKLYVADTYGMYEFSINQLYHDDAGDAFMPAVARLRSTDALHDQQAIVSSLSLDSTTQPAQLVTVGYHKTDTPSYVYRYDLTKNNDDIVGSAAASSDQAVEPIVARSIQKIERSHIQGVASDHGTTIINSSSEILGGSGRTNAMFDYKKPSQLKGQAMPGGGLESLYIDTKRQTVWSLNESAPKNYHGKAVINFIFNFPLNMVQK